MKKGLLVMAAALLPVAWGGTTYVVSNQFEPAYDQLLSQLNQQGVMVEKRAMESGFTQSTAYTTLQLPSEAGSDDVEVVLRHDVQHGPVVTDGGLQLVANRTVTTIDMDALAEETKKEIVQLFAGKVPLQVVSTTGFSGVTDVLVDVAAAQQEKDGVAFNFAGGQGDFTVTRSGDVKGQLDLGSLALKSPATNAEMKSAALTIDVRPVTASIYEGTSAFQIAGVDMSGEQAFHVDAFDFSSSLKPNKDTFDMQLDFAAKGVSGDDIPLNSMTYGLDFTGVKKTHLQQLEALQKEVNQLDDEVQIIERVKQFYTQAIEQGVGMVHRASIDNTHGKGQFSVDMEFTGGDKIQTLSDAKTVRELIGALAVKVDIEAEKALINNSPAVIALPGLQQQGFIKETDDQYQLHATLKQSALVVNEMPLPIESIIGPMIDLPLTALTN